jgi:hypothetical protein
MMARDITRAQRTAGITYHVDFEPQLEAFYRACGFRPTAGGVLDLSAPY